MGSKLLRGITVTAVFLAGSVAVAAMMLAAVVLMAAAP